MSAPDRPVATMLVVDDKEENRTLIRYLFDEPEYRVVEAADGLEGLALAERERPDCIILDLSMPGLSGLQVLERLQADPRTREIPVLILTATDESLEMMERALRAGAVDYITKPISPVRVAIRVRGAIERRRLLREVQELRGAFTSMLVHDLRAPLTVTMAYIDLIRQTVTGPAAEEQQGYLAKMEQACGQMIGLIGEILDLSKLEAGKLTIDPHPLDLSALVAEVVQRFSPAAVQKSIDLRMERVAQPAMVLADQNRLDQVLMNLLTNALKFTPRGGRISVEAIDLGNEVEVGVIDTGPGIAPEELPLLFEKFSQTATGKNTATHGTGLGLVICRHLIEAHSGRIWVESQPGQGARFAFRLPLIARQAGASGRQRSILVVDDDARVAGFLADLLTADGHAVEIAVTGEAAIQRLEQRPYDVIVSDIRLPDRDGLGLYREIASRRPTLCSRFVFITGYRLAPETREFLAQTGAPCLSKPFALEELEGFVRRIPLNPAVDEATAR